MVPGPPVIPVLNRSTTPPAPYIPGPSRTPWHMAMRPVTRLRARLGNRRMAARDANSCRNGCGVGVYSSRVTATARLCPADRRGEEAGGSIVEPLTPHRRWVSCCQVCWLYCGLVYYLGGVVLGGATGLLLGCENFRSPESGKVSGVYTYPHFRIATNTIHGTSVSLTSEHSRLLHT